MQSQPTIKCSRLKSLVLTKCPVIPINNHISLLVHISRISLTKFAVNTWLHTGYFSGNHIVSQVFRLGKVHLCSAMAIISRKPGFSTRLSGIKSWAMKFKSASASFDWPEFVRGHSCATRRIVATEGWLNCSCRKLGEVCMYSRVLSLEWEKYIWIMYEWIYYKTQWCKISWLGISTIFASPTSKFR